MFGIKIRIPKQNAQEVTELESWTVSWKVATSLSFGNEKTFNKVFIVEKEAREFKDQLEASASFIKTRIVTDICKN